MSVARELSPLSGSGVSARGRSAAARRKEGESVRAVQIYCSRPGATPRRQTIKADQGQSHFHRFWEFDLCQLVKVECRLEMN